MGAGAFVLGVATGAVVGPFVTAVPGSPITYLATLVVCVPFLLPTTWYRRYPALWFWMAAAAAFATLRAVFMAGFLLPHQTISVWLLKVLMDLLAATVLWLAVIALRRVPE